MLPDISFFLQEGNAILERCQALVDQLALFSTNEDADDLASAGAVAETGVMPTRNVYSLLYITSLLMCRPEVHADSSHAWRHSCTDQSKGS